MLFPMAKSGRFAAPEPARATEILPTKAEAISRAREISRNQGTELFIHGRDGKIQSRDSHGHDPFPPKG